MLSLSLDEHRCNTCTKLLFKGTLGMGLIEVKCSRCGTLSLIHSFANYLKAKPTAYIIVYNPVGRVIAGSKSTKRILGKSIADIQDIHDIQPDIKLPPVPNVKVEPDGALTQLEEWQHAYETLPHTATIS